MSKDCDEIDFSKLEKELSAAVEADNKYSRENAAKFRAVEQRVGSYEEFRDIVLASHLKPLERKDIYGESKRHQPLNSLCDAKKTNSSSENQAGKISNNEMDGNLPTQPTSAVDFVKSWKKLSKEISLKYEYITRIIKTALLEKLLTSEQIGDILGEILVVLDTNFTSIDAGKMIDILKNLKKSKRFPLWLQFLTKSEKQSAANLFEKLEDAVDEEQQYIIDELKNDFLRLHS